jgi:hypothetical protein
MAPDGQAETCSYVTFGGYCITMGYKYTVAETLILHTRNKF